MGDRLTLAEETARRLILAGVLPDDPGLAQWQEWNARAFERAGMPNPRGEAGHGDA